MRISVILDSPEGMYFAGDKITGEVTVDIDRPETLKKITATLRGVAKIAFREGGTMPFFLSSSNLYHDQQTVISREMIVFANSNICPVMEKGTYSYSFNFLLPNSMVTSFDSSHGYVIYNIDVAVKKKYFTERIRRELKIYEFNEDTPQLSYRPLCFEKVLMPRVSCFFPVFFSRKDARARCHIYIPRISFYCGESIQVNVLLMDYQVANQGKSTVITTELLQEFIFQGGLYNQRIIEPRRVIVAHKSRGVCANHHLEVPVCPRTGGLYRRARVMYYLRVSVKLFCRRYDLLIPVTITGPLNDMSRKWKSQFSHSSVSSDTDGSNSENMLRDQQRWADNLLSLLTTRDDFSTSLEALDIPDTVLEEGCDEVAMMMEIESTPDIFATALGLSTHRANLEES